MTTDSPAFLLNRTQDLKWHVWEQSTEQMSVLQVTVEETNTCIYLAFTAWT